MRARSVSDSVVVDAAPGAVYDLVAAPGGYGRFSPEATGADTGGGLDVGAVFVGTNRRGPLRWTTRCVVTEAEPGRRFAFRVQVWGLRRPVIRLGLATWSYDLEPVGDGRTRVTETWTDERGWPDALAAVVDPLATGRRGFAEFQRANIRRTLDGLAGLLAR